MLGPRVKIASLKTLRRLLAYLGATSVQLAEFDDRSPSRRAQELAAVAQVRLKCSQPRFLPKLRLRERADGPSIPIPSRTISGRVDRTIA
jgi:hypothetical protein